MPIRAVRRYLDDGTERISIGPPGRDHLISKPLVARVDETIFRIKPQPVFSLVDHDPFSGIRHAI